jgi:hypothetical protein
MHLAVSVLPHHLAFYTASLAVSGIVAVGPYRTKAQAYFSRIGPWSNSIGVRIGSRV